MRPRFEFLLAVLLIGGAALAAYHNSFRVPFVFDDEGAIVNNPGIRHLWPPGAVLFPSPVSAYDAGLTTSGRPVVSLSLALNYAVGGAAVRGYHAVNLAIHSLAGLALYGIVRRTLLRPACRDRFGVAAYPLALATALLWILHPLQTEAVTYVVQRAESLMGLFYLLTLYCFVRGVESPQPGRWFVPAVAACLCGMATKEVMVSAPLLVLLYDRTFVAGSLRDAWRQRGRWHLAFAGTWLLLAGLVLESGSRGYSAGFGTGITWWSYALTQLPAVFHYLRLAFWPHPLVFDYGTALVRDPVTIAASAVPVVLLAAATLVALVRRPALGFAGLWFFAILAPSSSIVPVTTEVMAEHRMYLPLAAVIVVLVLGLYARLGRRALLLGAAVALAFGWLTIRRNEDYRSEVAIWTDTVAKKPRNARAHYNLGHALAVAGDPAAAVTEYEAALALKPDYAEAHNNLANALSALGRDAAAVAHYNEALRLRPDFVAVHHNLAGTLARLGRPDEALAHYEQVLQLAPHSAAVHYAAANLLAQTGHLAEAVVHYRESLRLEPGAPGVHLNLGSVLLRLQQWPEAVAQDEEAARLAPDSAEAHYNLGNALTAASRPAEAVAHYETALRLAPGMVAAHNNLALALVQLGRADEAVGHYEAALRLMPDSPDLHYNFALALVRLGRTDEAARQCAAVLRLRPDYAEARQLALSLRGAP